MSPRNIPTVAAFNQSFEFIPGTCWRRPHDNPAIGFIEGLQFIAGMDDKGAIAAVAPNIDISLFGPTSFYGPRAVGQFERVIEELNLDIHSRRAVVMIAHHDDTSHTLPCTLSMNFYIDPNSHQVRNTITVRSSDAVWGLPYDQIQYGMVTLAVASCLGFPCGNVLVNITNAHIYDDHAGGKLWGLNAFSMPMFSTWDKYIHWAKATVEFHPTRKELEKLFFLGEIK